MLQQEMESLTNIEVLYSHVVKEIQGEDAVNGLLLQDVKTGGEKSLAVDGVFIAVGIHPNTMLLESMVDMDESGYVIAGEDCVTSREGIFAAGDTRKKPLRQIVTAVADGANAAVSAAAYCDKT